MIFFLSFHLDGMAFCRHTVNHFVCAFSFWSCFLNVVWVTSATKRIHMTHSLFLRELCTSFKCFRLHRLFAQISTTAFRNKAHFQILLSISFFPTEQFRFNQMRLPFINLSIILQNYKKKIQRIYFPWNLLTTLLGIGCKESSVHIDFGFL